MQGCIPDDLILLVNSMCRVGVILFPFYLEGYLGGEPHVSKFNCVLRCVSTYLSIETIKAGLTRGHPLIEITMKTNDWRTSA